MKNRTNRLCSCNDKARNMKNRAKSLCLWNDNDDGVGTTSSTIATSSSSISCWSCVLWGSIRRFIRCCTNGKNISSTTPQSPLITCHEQQLIVTRNEVKLAIERSWKEAESMKNECSSKIEKIKKLREMINASKARKHVVVDKIARLEERIVSLRERKAKKEKGKLLCEFIETGRKEEDGIRFSTMKNMTKSVTHTSIINSTRKNECSSKIEKIKKLREMINASKARKHVVVDKIARLEERIVSLRERKAKKEKGKLLCEFIETGRKEEDGIRFSTIKNMTKSATHTIINSTRNGKESIRNEELRNVENLLKKLSRDRTIMAMEISLEESREVLQNLREKIWLEFRQRNMSCLPALLIGEEKTYATVQAAQ